MVSLRIEQISPKLGRVSDNLDLHWEKLLAASQDGVQVLVFPELSLTGYLLKDLVPDVALTVDELLQRLRAYGDQVRSVEAVIGFVEESRAHRFHNAAAFVRWNELGELDLVHVHRKVYLPTYGLFDEGRYFSPGRSIRSFESKALGKCGILICEDAWHVSLPLLLSLDGSQFEGAGVVFVLSNSPARGVQEGVDGVPASYQTWEHLLKTYAGLLEVVIVYAGRAGVEDGLIFSSGSQVLASGGETVAKAAHFETDRLDVVLDWPDVLRTQRLRSLVSANENVDLLQRELGRIVRTHLGV